MSMSRWRFRQWWCDEGPINSHRPRYLYPAYAARRNRICCGLKACQPRRLQWVMLMNPSISNAPISNLLETTRSTELRLARNHAVLSFCVGAPPMASLKTLSVMRHRHLCPCLSTMPKAVPSNSISNPSFKRDKANRSRQNLGGGGGGRGGHAVSRGGGGARAAAGGGGRGGGVRGGGRRIDVCPSY